MVRAAIARAARYTDDMEFSAEDASRTDPDFLCQILRDRDRVRRHHDQPARHRGLRHARRVRGHVPARPGAGARAAAGVVLSAHCHDDLGLAVANSLAAIEAGAPGRWNAPSTASVSERVTRPWRSWSWPAGCEGRRSSSSADVDSREIYRTSQLLSYLTGVFPPPNKAIVGRNAFAHEAGIHQHGMLQNGLTYEIIRPEMVGIPRSTLVLGKHSGRHALERRYQELGYQLEEAELAEVYQSFIALAERKREILDEDLLALVHESFHDAPEEFQLTHLRVVCGSVTATAEVRLTGPWSGERSARGTGDGPIAAAFTAVSDILGRQSRY